jgi:hypothetical protein
MADKFDQPIADLEFKPKFCSVRINETEHFKDWSEKYTFGGKIYGVYIYDANEQTYCCEMTPSYCLYPIGYTLEWDVMDLEEMAANSGISTDDLEDVENMADKNVTYIHCGSIDRLPDTDKVLQVDYALYPDEWDETYRYLLDKAQEDYRGNPDW